MSKTLLDHIVDTTPAETQIFVEKYTAIVMRINQILKTKNISQKQLADKLNKKPAEISKWLNQEQNLTLKTIAKLEAALEESIISIIPNSKFVNSKQGASVHVKEIRVSTHYQRKGFSFPALRTQPATKHTTLKVA